MATTTNYSWTTPDDTALVKDGASAIRSLGTSIDTTTKNLNPSTTLGDVEYRSSTANTNTRLGIGTTGQVLTVSGGVPAWATISAGGMTLLSTTAMTGTSVNLTSISGSYKTLYGLAYGYTNTGSNDYFVCNPNSANAVESASFAHNNGPVSYSPAIPLSYPANTYQVDKTNANNISWFEIKNYASSTNYKAFTSGGTYTSTSSGSTTWFSSGGVKTNSAITSILFQNTGGGSFSTGTILLYGVN